MRVRIQEGRAREVEGAEGLGRRGSEAAISDRNYILHTDFVLASTSSTASFRCLLRHHQPFVPETVADEIYHEP